MGRAEAGVAGEEDGMAALRTSPLVCNKVKERKRNKGRQSLRLSPSVVTSARPNISQRGMLL